MTSRPRWTRRDGKRPVTTAGRCASSTDTSTWTTLREVLDSRTGDGIGFMLGGGVGCIDLDHCLDGGRVSPLARRVLDALPDTYVEVSPSGTGLHVFGLLPERAGRKVAGVEVYSRARFMTVTGVPHEASSPVLGDLSAVADALTM